MFNTILIANRGEIACRIAATAKRMGMRTVAVYSDADAQAAHVAACDMAVHIGGSEAKNSYLCIPSLINAAQATGTQAIHPGYGFLSENEEFARACNEAGIQFIGPPASALAAMGDKATAKNLMAQADVPIVPGYHGSNQDPHYLQEQAGSIGYPLLIKASAGGGGKGMRIVHHAKDFPQTLHTCQREAMSSFGNARVLLERYIEKPRHIEIQIFADTHGHCVHLFERDCSIQRRYQKVIEEAPAPGMTQQRRNAMGAAAIAAARAVDYVGAGTVEFITDDSGAFYFMEMNTRLQVEHPVTELITGHDLVQWQFEVAAGKPLPCTQDALAINGHAIEARIYAENPNNNFLPSTGRLSVLHLPGHLAFQDGDVRIDSGVRQGDTLSSWYDPMIAKVIVRGSHRDEARMRMMHTLDQIRVAGVDTNIAFVRRIMADDSFAHADLDTHFISRRHHDLLATDTQINAPLLALAAGALLATEKAMPTLISRTDKAIPNDPWALNDGWRLSGAFQRTITLHQNDQSYSIFLQRQNNRWSLAIGEEQHTFFWKAGAVCSDGAQLVTIQCGNTRHQAWTACAGDELTIFFHGQTHHFRTRKAAVYGDDNESRADSLTAPMPGKIIAVLVDVGAKVAPGQRLVVMEAMKMEHAIEAPTAGTVDRLFFAVGDQVEEGAELIALR